MPYSSLLEEPTETVSLPSGSADLNDVAGVMLSSDDVAMALHSGGTKPLPKAAEITNMGMQICIYNIG